LAIEQAPKNAERQADAIVRARNDANPFGVRVVEARTAAKVAQTPKVVEKNATYRVGPSDVRPTNSVSSTMRPVKVLEITRTGAIDRTSARLSGASESSGCRYMGLVLDARL